MILRQGSSPWLFRLYDGGDDMRTGTRRIVALLAVICILITQLSASLAAGWISVEKNLRSPLGAEQVDVNIRNVGKRISNVCYDLQCEYPTSLYQLTANGVRHDDGIRLMRASRHSSDACR